MYPIILGCPSSQCNEALAVEVGDEDVEVVEVDVDVVGDVEDVDVVGVVVVEVDVVDGGAEMIKSTGMDCGVLVAPVAVTVMVVG